MRNQNQIYIFIPSLPSDADSGSDSSSDSSSQSSSLSEGSFSGSAESVIFSNTGADDETCTSGGDSERRRPMN